MKIELLLSAVLAAINVISYAQLTINPPNTFAKCPNEWTVYTVTNAVNAACIHDWTITAINPCNTNSRTYAATGQYCDDCGYYPLPPCDPMFVATFPNPTQSQLSISLGEDYYSRSSQEQLDLLIELMDNQGMKRRSIRANKQETILNTQDLPKGTYYLRVVFPKGAITRQIIKE